MINIAGQLPPASNHIPSRVACITEDLWRDYCYQGAISGRDRPNTKQNAFKRAAETLLAKGCIGKWGDLVWIVAS